MPSCIWFVFWFSCCAYRLCPRPPTIPLRQTSCLWRRWVLSRERCKSRKDCRIWKTWKAASARLKAIVETYPGSDLAVRLISGDAVVGGASLRQIEEFTGEKRNDILIYLCSSLPDRPDSLDPFSDERCKPYLDTVAARYANIHDDFDMALTLARTIEDVRMRGSAFVSIGMAWIKAKDFESVIGLSPEIERPDRRDFLLGKHQKVWGNQAARGSVSPELSPAFSPGYHCSNFPLSVSSRVRVRACSMRCAPGFDHCIC